MAASDPDISTLIICICVIIPAVIAISVCAIVYYGSRRDRKLSRPIHRSFSYEYEPTIEPVAANNYIIDLSSVNNAQQERRPRRQFSIIEQQPPPYYHTTIVRTQQQPVPLFSPIRTIPSSADIHRSSPIVTPSAYTSMPPSYAEIFLRPNTLPYG